MVQPLPYCGSAPTPGELLSRFNADPWLIAVLLVLATAHVIAARRSGRAATAVLAGWLFAAAALVSPICALSVSLFSARVGQHMILILLSAPLIALGLGTPQAAASRSVVGLWTSAAVFFGALWFWHMPYPYAATFESIPLYWCMHVTLFGSALWLWTALLNHSLAHTGAVLAAGAITSMQMGLLGAVLSLADHPLFAWHATRTAAWGLTPLQDQQLGGILMWVPGITLFLWTAIRSLSRLWESFERERLA